jgi:PAS domain S-box-containing protein
MNDKLKIKELLKRIEVLEFENEQLKQSDHPHGHCPLCENDSLCRYIIENQRELICRFLPNGTLTFVNKAYCLFFKRSRDQLVGTNFFDLIPPEAHKQAKDSLAAITKENPTKTFVHPVLAPNGEQCWQQWSDCGLFSEKGELTGYQSIGRDITEFKKAQDLLTQKEGQLRALVRDVLNDTDVGFCLLDKNLHSVWVNKTLQRFFGCGWKEIVGKDKKTIIKEKFAPLIEDPEAFEQQLIDAYERGALLAGYECHILESDKVAERWLHIRSKPINSGYYAGGRIEQYTDITQIKLSQIALRESQQRFKDLADLLPETVFEADIDGKITYANKVAFKYFGYDTVDLDKGYNMLDMIHPEDRQKATSNFRKILKGVKSGINEYTAIRKDGSTFPVWTSSTSIKENGTPRGFRGFIIDISEHKQKTTELELLHTAIGQVSEAIEITDSEGRMLFVNQAMQKITGYSRDELIGKNPKVLKSGREASEAYENLWSTISSGKKWRGQLVNRKKDGSLYTEDVSITSVRDSKGSICNYVAVKRDITEETKNEEKIRSLQKMEALGTLAGGIAHDFNNILTGVIGYTELSLFSVPPKSEVHRNLKETIKGCKRAKKLIDQILKFSRINEVECAPHKIRNVIEDALSLLRSTLPANIEIDKQIDSFELVVIDPTYMHQIVMNLCTNAFHAMNETGGRLGVSLTTVDISLDDVLHLSNMNPGPHAKLSISDTGHGMKAETVQKIFDPYFSTKDKHNGTGLGLSVVHGIVKSCGGKIDVYSELGVGTTFNVCFPIVGLKDASETDAARKPVQSTGAGERILFVDDEKTIADIGTRILEILGYQATARTSSIEALEAFRANPYGFDLVITDMTMPNMTGDHLAEKLKAIRPDIPIIVCTGFSNRINAAKAAALGISVILTKPVFKDDYARAVKNVLENKIQKDM